MRRLATRGCLLSRADSLLVKSDLRKVFDDMTHVHVLSHVYYERARCRLSEALGHMCQLLRRMRLLGVLLDTLLNEKHDG